MMSRKQRIVLFWVLVFSLNLVPLVASGEPRDQGPARGPSNAPAEATHEDMEHLTSEVHNLVTEIRSSRNTTAATTATASPSSGTTGPSGASRYRFDDLTVADANSTFLNFQAAIDGQDPGNRAVLFGMVFNDCKPFFQFANTHTDSSISDSGVAGFRIRDVGGQGRACMAAHKAANDVCSVNNPCTRLSQIDGGSLDLSSSGDVAIKLLHVDPNQDRNQNQWEAFDPNNAMNHTSAATLALQANQRAAAARQAQIDRARQQIRSCRANEDQLAVARAARDFLVSMGALSDSEVNSLNRELDRSEIADFARRASHASIEDLETLREDMAAWAAAHPDSNDTLLPVYHQVALRYVNQRGAGPDAYDEAAATISEAQGLSISDVNSSRLDGYQRDISVGRVQSTAGNPMVFWPSYYNLMNQMQQDTMNACFSNGASMEGCASARQAITNAQSLPQREQQIETQRYQLQMQMQQQMAQFGMGGSGAMGGMGPAWAGGYYGGQGNTGFFSRTY